MNSVCMERKSSRSANSRHIFGIFGVFGILPSWYPLRMPDLSVVIPAHKRPDILKRCLWHLQLQTVHKSMEAIVVSDGGDRETEDVVKEAPGVVPITFL